MDNGITPLKKCIKCGKGKPSTSEYFQVRSSGKLRGECRECTSAWFKEYYRQHREAKRAYDREYYREHDEKIKADARQYYADNTEWVKARMRRWNYTHRKQRLIYVRRHYNRYSQSARAYRAQLRARKYNTPGSFTAEDVKRQYELQNGKCFWCAKKLKGVYDVDHYIPLFRGGSNDADNIVCACPRCNRSKGHKLPQEWGRLF